MLIDHTAVVFGLPMWLRVIGRLAFPIYCFLITEGIAHTGSPGRYFLRLGIMAVISEPIYDFVLYSGRSPWAHQNVLWLLLLGAVMVEGMGRVKQPVWKILLIVPCYFIADALHLSYGGNGILLMALISNALTLFAIDSNLQNVLIGSIMVISVAIDEANRRRQK